MSSSNALSNEETENQNVSYADIRCPCLIPDTKGVHQCTMMFKSKLGTSPLRLDQFMKHYVSKVHHGAQVPNEVKKWFPHGCPTPGCRHRYTTTGKRLQDHIKQCSLAHNTAQTQQRQTDSEWEQIGNNAAARGRKSRQNATTKDVEWEQIGNDAITRGQKPNQNPQLPAQNVNEQVERRPRRTLNTSPPRCATINRGQKPVQNPQLPAQNVDEQAEPQPRRTQSTSPPRCATTNWIVDRVHERQTGEAEWSHLEDNSAWIQVVSKTQRRRLANKPATPSTSPTEKNHQIEHTRTRRQTKSTRLAPKTAKKSVRVPETPPSPEIQANTQKTAKKSVRVPETPPSPVIQDNDGIDEPTESQPNQELTTTTDTNPTQTQTQTQILAQAQDLLSRTNTSTQTPTHSPTQTLAQTQQFIFMNNTTTQTQTQTRTQTQTQTTSQTQPPNHANEQEDLNRQPDGPHNQELEADIENRLRIISEEVDLQPETQQIRKFGFFDNDEWDKVIIYWKGTSLKRIPTECIETFREITNEAAEESLTGNKSAIRALKMIPRLLLWKINGNRHSLTKTLNSRMDLWKTRKYAQLWNELQTHETKQDKRIPPSPPSKDDVRITTAYERVELAELSKAMTSLLSPGLYSGNPDSIQNLFATGRPEDQLIVPRHELPDAPIPEISPENFASTINSRTRGGAQAGDGWRMDHIKDINTQPKQIDDARNKDDPLGPFREFCINYAAGRLPVDDQFYLLLAGGKVAALSKPDSTAPRPVVIVDIFRRLGMATMISESRQSLGSFFGNRKEYGVGIQAPGQILSWLMKLSQEEDPWSIQLWSDLTNGFNAIHRQSIEKGLQKFPADLQWLQRSFHAFYSGKSTLQYRHHVNNDFTVIDILSEGGVFQGDSASGIFFSAGLQEAFDKLQAEYPEALLVKYLYDLNGTIRTNNMVSTLEPRAQALHGAYNNEAEVPLTVAILKRWEFLAKTLCGLEASPKKRGVVSLLTPLDEHTTFNINVKDGLKVAGIPIGNDTYVKQELSKIIRENVETAFDAVNELPDLQYQHLLNLNCGGNSRAQHLWQTIRPDLAIDEIKRVDNLTKKAVSPMMEMNAMETPEIEQQCFHPQRFGGLGYRKAENIANAAYIGGFALATLGPFGISQLAPHLVASILHPEDDNDREIGLLQYPSLNELQNSWVKQIKNHRIIALCKAAVAGSLAPPRQPDETDNEFKSRQKQKRQHDNAHYEAVWKNIHIKGTESPDITPQQLTTTILQEAEAAWNRKLNPTEFQNDRYQNPDKHPSIICNLWSSGEQKIQQLLSRLNDMDTSILLLSSPRTTMQQARVRGKLNKMANIPLQATPSRNETRFSNEEWKTIINDRLLLPNLMGLNIGNQSCKCKTKINDGRHFRRCPISNNMLKIHDGLRREFLKMVRSAGLTAVEEQPGLLQDNPLERPGDIFIVNWEIKTGTNKNKDLRIFSKHAIDLSFPLVDSNWQSNSNLLQQKLGATVGIIANKKTKMKLTNTGTQAEKNMRGNSLTMQQRCAAENVNYWPVPIEGDGQTSKSFDSFLNKVSDYASSEGHNSQCFKKFWTTNLACILAKKGAQAIIRRTSAEYKRLARIPSSDLEIMRHPYALIPELTGVNKNKAYYYRFSNGYNKRKTEQKRYTYRRT